VIINGKKIPQLLNVDPSYFSHLYFSYGNFGDEGQAVNKTTSIFKAIHVTPKDTPNSTLHSFVPSVSGCCCL